ncbi:MAG: YdcF family protein [Algicola sp.]|nr:YdcF family protein [Algicola sp.]
MDTVFYWLSKSLWVFVAPSSILVLLMLVGWILLLRNHYGPAKKCFSVFAVLMLSITILPIGQWMLLPLEQRFVTNPKLPEKVDGIIVLSGSERAFSSHYWQQEEFGGSVERNLAFMDLARRYPQAKLVFTGGTGSLTNQQYKEADVAKRLYQRQGLDVSKILFETQARNTAENASLSHQMVKPSKGENWILITTAWHMPRSVGLFCQQQWPMLPYPVDHWTVPGHSLTLSWSFSGHLSNLDMATKEWLGLLAYYATGKIPSLLPQNCLPQS